MFDKWTLRPCVAGSPTAAAANAKKAAKLALKRPTGDPVTSDRLYSDEECSFLAACVNYRQQYAKPFMTACDYLVVAKSLGYKLTSDAPIP